MDTSKTIKLKKKQQHFSDLYNFVEFIFNLKQSERLDYFKHISQAKLKLITEISLNVLKGRLKLHFRQFKLLTTIKKTVRLLASKSVGFKKKKSVLSSIQGLQYFNIILPYILNTFKS